MMKIKPGCFSLENLYKTTKLDQKEKRFVGVFLHSKKIICKNKNQK